jgi:hypothetical protein
LWGLRNHAAVLCHVLRLPAGSESGRSMALVTPLDQLSEMPDHC